MTSKVLLYAIPVTMSKEQKQAVTDLEYTNGAGKPRGTVEFARIVGNDSREEPIMMKNMFYRKIIVLIIGWVLVSTCPAWADFGLGEDAYLEQDYENAMREWAPACFKGECRGPKHGGVHVSMGAGRYAGF